MPDVTNVSDLIMESGKTWREENLELQHNIPIGTLVEIVDADGDYDINDKEGPGAKTGLRLFVVKHARDCDGEPLYSLSHDKNAAIDEYQFQKKLDQIKDHLAANCSNQEDRIGLALTRHALSLAQGSMVMGIAEDSLKIIRHSTINDDTEKEQ